MRPLFDIFNANFKRFASANNYSVDGSMIPYYGRHGTKQSIRGKPIQFGFKVWCLCLSDSYRIHTKPYRGKDTNLLETELGQGSDVILGMSE